MEEKYNLTFEEMENILNDVDVVYAITSAINESLRDKVQYISSYFTTGNCNIYVEILYQVFENHTKFYIDDSIAHVAGGVGDLVVDVDGPYRPNDASSFEQITKDEFYMATLGFGSYSKYNEELIAIGTAAGKAKLDEIVRNRGRKR